MGQLTLLLALLLLVPARASAQGVGVRAGVSGDPQQFYFGGHAEIGPIADDRLWFRPNLEIGVGNNLTLTTANFELAYNVPVQMDPWRLYAGGGPALNIYRTGGVTDTKPGFNLLVGVAHRQGFFTGLKVGLLDSPSVKFGVGYTWKR